MTRITLEVLNLNAPGIRRVTADDLKPRKTPKHVEERRKGAEADGKLLMLRANVIKARMQAHGMDWRQHPLLGLQLLAFCGLENWLGKPNEKATLERATKISEPYIAAALANPSLTETEAEVRRNPPIRFRFDQASAYGTLGDCFAATDAKSWGPFVGVFPVEPNVYLGGRNIVYAYHKNSRYNRRFEQRKYLKRALGKGFRKLVADAMDSTKTRFVEKRTEADAAALKRKLGMDAGRFWRVATGKEFIDIPGHWVQGDLLAEVQHVED